MKIFLDDVRIPEDCAKYMYTRIGPENIRYLDKDWVICKNYDEFTPVTSNPTWIGDQYFIKNYRTMDVGMDTNKLYPYHLDEIVEKMRYKEVLLEVDHHSELTN